MRDHATLRRGTKTGKIGLQCRHPYDISRIRRFRNPPKDFFKPMTKQTKAAHLAEHKTRLADKYDHAAKIVSSKVRRASYQRLAAKYRRQAKDFKLAS